MFEQVRTPLSTASMGLELLNLAMSQQSFTTSTAISTRGQQQSSLSNQQLSARSTHGAGGGITQDDHELLLMVQESIRVAVGVFDHLIQYDALDNNDDEMLLHYQPIKAASMMNVVIAPMTLEARSKEVLLLGNLIDLRRLDSEAASGTLTVNLLIYSSNPSLILLTALEL